MRRQVARRSSLFLMELIISILFFSLASAVCVQFFVKSHTLSQDTEKLNMALNQVSGYAELFLAEDDFPKYLEEHDAQSNGHQYTVYYDENWQKSKESDSAFQIDIALETHGKMQKIDIHARESGGDDIYTISTKKYLGREEMP